MTSRATHMGTINLGGAQPVACYVLDDGTRVLGTAQIQGLLGVAKGRDLGRSIESLAKDSDALAVSPRPFVPPGGGRAHGYDAEDVVRILAAYQRAFVRGTLHPKQESAALAAMSALEAFAHVGLRGLIDEATGFIARSDRQADEFQAYFQRVFRAEMRGWSLTFECEWDKSVCKLYGYDYLGKPPVFGGPLNALAYSLAFGDEAYQELKRRNPKPVHGSNHHQQLTDEARAVLAQTMRDLIVVMRLSVNAAEFFAKVEHLYRGAPLQLGFAA